MFEIIELWITIMWESPLKPIGMNYLKTNNLKLKWNYFLQFFEILPDFVENIFKKMLGHVS
jgi:hypothetical protein